jgi:hypothetical protein
MTASERMIRGAAPYSRSLYFNVKGRERGLAVRAPSRLRALPQPEVSQATGNDARSRSQPLSRTPGRTAVRRRGWTADIAIGNLIPSTEERQKTVDMVAAASRKIALTCAKSWLPAKRAGARKRLTISPASSVHVEAHVIAYYREPRRPERNRPNDSARKAKR